ncbi:MAG TPA: SDR family oxidoreductase [Candidatus Limnocylindrales bacterium]|nr:SDR family oxidoreductase [Candidatus Limnocylindrales bacterium]
MKCLVTGGAGFIGSHIISRLLEKGYQAVCLDNFDPTYDITTKKGNIAPFLKNNNFELVEGDVRDRNLLKDIVRDIDYIFHEAALVSVVESMKDPVKTIEMNTIGSFNILDAALSGNVKKVILASSAAIYGDSPVLPKKESMVPVPKSPYAISKLDGEYAARIYYEEHGLKTTSLRYFNVYGPRQDPTSPYAAAIPIFIQKALKDENILIYGDGMQTRDFVHVNDVVRANELVMSKGDGKTFNVANGIATSINEIAQQIIKQTDSRSRIIHAKERSGDIKHSVADITEISNIGFKPKYTMKEGLKNTVEWFRSIHIRI